MRSHTSALWTFATASVAVLAFAANARAQSAAPAVGVASDTQEVIVTARKRSESIQDVPVSIAAFSGKQLATLGISDTSDLVRSVPDMSIQDGGPGYRSIYIRGVASENGNAPTTGFYIDDTFVQPGGVVQAVVDPLYFDVDHVEVLRGPQGTVFGGSSMGGTVRVITNQPNFNGPSADTDIKVSETEHGGFNYETSAVGNLVLIPDRVALRIVGSYRDVDGYINKDIGSFAVPQPDADRSQTGPVAVDKDINRELFGSIRAALAIRVTPDFTVTPSVFYQRDKSTDFGTFDKPPGDDLTEFRAVNVSEPLTDEFTLGNIKAVYNIPGYSLLSSTGFSRRSADFDEDGSDYLHDVFLPENGLPGVYLPNTVHGWRREDMFTQEVRLSTNSGDRLQYVVGAYYEDYDRSSGLYWRVPDLIATFPFLANVVPNGLLFTSADRLHRQQEAVFGEATYKLTSKLSLTGGLRYFDYQLRSRSLPAQYSASSQDGVSPRVSLSYQIERDDLVYATISKGFRPGGPNAEAIPSVANACRSTYASAGFSIDASGQISPYKSDEVTNYEIGEKSSLFGDRLTLNSSIYYIRWDNIQQIYFPTCGVGYGIASTQNVGNADIKGLEAEYNAKLTSDVRLFGGFSFNDAEIAENVPLLEITAGTPIENAPKWMTNINLEYSFTGPWQLPASALLTYRFIDRSYRTLDRSNPNTYQDAYNLLSARLTFTRGPWTAALYADNLLNEHPAVSDFTSTFGVDPARERLFTIQPLTVGLDLRRKF